MHPDATLLCEYIKAHSLSKGELLRRILSPVDSLAPGRNPTKTEQNRFGEWLNGVKLQLPSTLETEVTAFVSSLRGSVTGTAASTIDSISKPPPAPPLKSKPNVNITTVSASAASRKQISDPASAGGARKAEPTSTTNRTQRTGPNLPSDSEIDDSHSTLKSSATTTADEDVVALAAQLKELQLDMEHYVYLYIDMRSYANRKAPTLQEFAEHIIYVGKGKDDRKWHRGQRDNLRTIRDMLTLGNGAECYVVIEVFTQLSDYQAQTVEAKIVKQLRDCHGKHLWNGWKSNHFCQAHWGLNCLVNAIQLTDRTRHLSTDDYFGTATGESLLQEAHRCCLQRV